uniref:Uncharacterized protein n=1 Tax=Lepeophtheirus salmonis TaxID=72036 RepID=A0A0K2UHJ3_LEPSM
MIVEEELLNNMFRGVLSFASSLRTRDIYGSLNEETITNVKLRYDIKLIIIK